MNNLAVLLSRIQFAFTAGFHFLMVPLTIGLILFVVIFELKYLRTGKKIYRDHANFWGNIFAINFVVGIVTGITMEIQFGTNWAEYSKFMGDIFGSPLAFEALIAFFLESTFAGIWIFYRHKISDKFRAVTAVLILIGVHISAIWIIAANGFMQNPVGYELAADGSRVLLTDFAAVALNPYAIFMLIHTITSAYLLGAFFILGVSAWHILKKNMVEFWSAINKTVLTVLLLSAVAQPVIGHFYGQYVGRIQPAKAAAFELNWETEDSVPFYLFQIPRPKEERNIQAIPIPYMGSLMHTNTFNGTVTGIKEATGDWTPQMVDDYKSILGLTHYSFRIMVGLGLLFILMALYGVILAGKDKFKDNKLLQKAFLWLLPAPWIAITLGWIVAEVGRQPWIVQGLMLTRDAVSTNVSAAQVAFSIGTILVFYAVLFAVEIYMVVKFIKKGPLSDPFRNRG